MKNCKKHEKVWKFEERKIVFSKIEFIFLNLFYEIVNLRSHHKINNAIGSNTSRFLSEEVLTKSQSISDDSTWRVPNCVFTFNCERLGGGLETFLQLFHSV